MSKSTLKQYRNKTDIAVNEEYTIDAGSLWDLHEGKLVLVDNDNYVETDLDLTLFEEIK